MDILTELSNKPEGQLKSLLIDGIDEFSSSTYNYLFERISLLTKLERLIISGISKKIKGEKINFNLLFA